MASAPHTHLYDAIIFHSDEEYMKAENLCKEIKSIKLEGGRYPTITTLEDFSILGKTYFANLEEALKAAWCIFCSEKCYTEDTLSTFSAHVAMTHKIPNRFVKIRIGGKSQSKPLEVNPENAMGALRGIDINEDWTVPDLTLKRINKLFSCQYYDSDTKGKKDVCLNDEPKDHMSELAETFNLNVVNSIDNMSIQSSEMLEPTSLSSNEDTEPKRVVKLTCSQPTEIEPGHSLPSNDIEEDASIEQPTETASGHILPPKEEEATHASTPEGDLADGAPGGPRHSLQNAHQGKRNPANKNICSERQNKTADQSACSSRKNPDGQENSSGATCISNHLTGETKQMKPSGSSSKTDRHHQRQFRMEELQKELERLKAEDQNDSE